MCLTSEQLAQLCECLPHPYRDLMDAMLDHDTDWTIRAALHGGDEVLELLLCIALDMLEVLRLASHGTRIHPLTNDHWLVVVECLVKKRRVEDVERELGADTRRKLQEASDFLLVGQLNLVEATLQLQEPQRTVFIRVFYEGISPEQVAAENPPLTVLDVERLFRDALNCLR